MPRIVLALLFSLVAAIVLLLGCSTISSQDSTDPPSDFSVAISSSVGSVRAGGSRVYTLGRLNATFVIERQTITKYEHLQEDTKQWDVDSARVDSIYAAVVNGDFFALPNSLKAEGNSYDCWGWKMTVSMEGQTHSVYVPCTASIPDTFVKVVGEFAAAGAEPLDLYGIR